MKEYNKENKILRKEESGMTNQVKEVQIVTLAEDYAGTGPTRCWAQHGVSFFIRLQYENKEVHHFLFDTGDYHEPILFNARKLNIPLDEIESIALSHSHYDHTGGLIGILKEIKKKERPIIAHPEVFKQSYYKGDFTRNIGMENEKTKEITESLGGIWKLSKEPVEIFPHVSFMGEIPRITIFEQDVTLKLQTKVNDQWVSDEIEDDTGIYISTPKGVIVIAGCSHSGIVNIVKYAKQLSGKQVVAVIGGFHLHSASVARINHTIDALEELGVKEVITGHCTGGDAEYAFKQRFKKQFQKLHAGKILSFS